MYTIELKSQPQKFIRGQSRDLQKRLVDRIERLGEDPLPTGSKQLHSQPNLYRIRVGDYRIIYHVDSEQERIVITRVGHRREVYRRL